MRRAPRFSFVLWSTVGPGLALAGCGHTTPLTDGGAPSTDVVSGTAFAVGEAACGETPEPRTFTFHNTGAATLTWHAAIDGAGFAIAQSDGSVEPGGTGEIAIVPAAVPTTTVAGATITATLIVTTNASVDPLQIPLQLVAHGGALAVDTKTIGFGQVQLTTTTDQPLAISNHGDRAIMVGLTAPGDAQFTASWDGAPTAATLEPGASLTGAAVHFTPSSAGTKSDSLAIATTGALCAGDPASIALGGEGTAAQVSITPGTVQFGTTDCGKLAPSQTVRITNGYTFALTYTAAINAGPYTIHAGQATGSVPASGHVDITVDAKTVPAATTSLAANALAGVMKVTTSAPAATPAIIDLAQAARGATLELSPAPASTLAFGDVIAGAPVTKTFTLKNSGNVAASVTASATGSGFSAIAPNGGSIPVGGVVESGSVTQTVAKRGNLTGSLSVATTTPLCQAAPGAVSLTAVGKAAVATIGTVPAMSALCGTGTPATVDIPITNSGDVTLVISDATTSNGFAVVTATPITIDVGKSAVITVRPPPSVIGTDVGGSTKSGVLKITTNEIGFPTHSVALSSLVTGAQLSLIDETGAPLTSINFQAAEACPSARNFTIKNTGTTAAHISNIQPAATSFKWTWSGNSFVTTDVAKDSQIRPITLAACTGSEALSLNVEGCQGPLKVDAKYTITGLASCFCS